MVGRFTRKHHSNVANTLFPTYSVITVKKLKIWVHYPLKAESRH